ncbi:LolA family protein [Nafulsella turpanensis]|uniref:LolA family protein n=1 Tax=Nafulsella turpanensis TaxID=1265690 RepID=UPI00034A455C|nr:outer membrane lipoprotein carrier protein LolA [Nafulsella turpanensis]
MSAFAGSLFAQYDPKALEVLDKASEKYEKLKSFKADFTFTLNNEVTGNTMSYKGDVVVKGKKFRVSTDAQELMTDGTTFWTYSPSINEVNVQNYEAVIGEFVDPSNIHNIYKKGYKGNYVEEKVINGKAHHIIDLEPTNGADNGFYKIQLVINKEDLTFSKFTIFEKNGNRFVVNLNNFTPNVEVAENIFTFNKSKHPKVVEVDLRNY